jgi:hypothetical protein
MSLIVTRKIAQSGKLLAMMALLVLLVMQVDPLLAENEAQIDLDEFNKLLDEIKIEVTSTQGDIKHTINTTETMNVEFVTSQLAYLEAFDEVIQKQIF